MSTSRIPEKAGHCNRKKLPRGANGNALCRQCSTECQNARSTFCSGDCVHEWKLTTQPAYQAEHVLKRDNGVCATCGVNCVAVFDELELMRAKERAERYGERAKWVASPSLDAKLERWVARCDALGLPRHLRPLKRRLWEMNHRTAVIEGGGGCGLDNLETLCWSCHRRHTSELAARRAAARRMAKPAVQAGLFEEKS